MTANSVEKKYYNVVDVSYYTLSAFVLRFTIHFDDFNDKRVGEALEFYTFRSRVREL